LLADERNKHASSIPALSATHEPELTSSKRACTDGPVGALIRSFKADLEKLLKTEGHMPEDKFLVMSRKGKRLGVAYVSTPRGEGGVASLKFKSK